MAKIYETQEDFTRDKLAEQAGAMHLKSAQQSEKGVAMIATSFFVDVLNMSMARSRSWLSAVGTFLGIVGMVDVFKGWSTKNKAHDLDMQRERMGPQRIVLPPDVAPELEKDCAPCALKNTFADRAGQKTLAEYAEKPLDSGKHL